MVDRIPVVFGLKIDNRKFYDIQLIIISFLDISHTERTRTGYTKHKLHLNDDRDRHFEKITRQVSLIGCADSKSHWAVSSYFFGTSRQKISRIEIIGKKKCGRISRKIDTACPYQIRANSSVSSRIKRLPDAIGLGTHKSGTGALSFLGTRI